MTFDEFVKTKQQTTDNPVANKVVGHEIVAYEYADSRNYPIIDLGGRHAAIDPTDGRLIYGDLRQLEQKLYEWVAVESQWETAHLYCLFPGGGRPDAEDVKNRFYDDAVLGQINGALVVVTTIEDAVREAFKGQPLGATLYVEGHEGQPFINQGCLPTPGAVPGRRRR